MPITTKIITRDNIVYEQFTESFPELNLQVQYCKITNNGTLPAIVTQLEPASYTVASTGGTLDYWTSGSGNEYTPEHRLADKPVYLECITGRSSESIHPQFALRAPDNDSVLLTAIAWSGNWQAEFKPAANATTVSAGLLNKGFAKTLQPGQSFALPKVVFVEAPTLNQAKNNLYSWARNHWFLPNELLSSSPVEWNHWWGYEDRFINEATFLKNVDLAAGLGFDVCTLDAGWFGRPELETNWFQTRGDWHLLNNRRFPNGLRVLADHVHSKGMKFGIWCEIEALGELAEVQHDKDWLVAKRGGASLGYVCLGNRAAQDWAFETLSGLIGGCNADWFKLDFNLNPGMGCDRTDHDHGSGDGLYEHYLGLYALLDRLRERFPQLLIENCASGGLRTDLGIMQHVHLGFLSDPDYSPHQLQVFTGASLILPPERCLHWSWSTTVQSETGHWPFPTFDFNRPDLSDKEIIFHTRVAMLHQFGFSHRLPEYGERELAFIRDAIRFFKGQVRPYLTGGKLYCLSSQLDRRVADDLPLQAFLLVSADDTSALLFVFNFVNSESDQTILLEGLCADSNYGISDYDNPCFLQFATGKALQQEGFLLPQLKAMESRIFRLTRNN
ncbi:MAG: glycoside hydrolase family 36 protein [Bacillota bacterium]